MPRSATKLPKQRPDEATRPSGGEVPYVQRGRQKRCPANAHSGQPRSAAPRSSPPRSRSSPHAATRARGSMTWRSAPASPRARSISTSPTRRRCFRNWCARWCTRCSARWTRCAASTFRRACWSRDCSGRSCAKSIGTRRKDLIRLILNEGPRFPAIAEFYYHEVIERVLDIVRPILARAAERGELPNDSLARFPQLIVAPMLVGIMWHAMFEKFEPLDVDAMVRAHIDILFAGGRDDDARPRRSPDTGRSPSLPAAIRTMAACRAGSRATSFSSGRTRRAGSRRSPCARAIRSRPARRCFRLMPTCSRPM